MTNYNLQIDVVMKEKFCTMFLSVSGQSRVIVYIFSTFQLW